MVAQQTRIGRYELISALARGGMAELFLARLPGEAGFAKQVVIKRVLPELAHDRAFVDMFVAEARIAATLDHPNIVHVHDIGHDAAGYFFAMERLHGGDLASIMSVVSRFGGALPAPLAIEIARAACAGLHYAHERRAPSGELLGLVHRDVSPQNLFVTFDGAVKLLDFGIAKAVEARPASHTRTGARRGKVPYMSPEQCRGEPLDRRSDVFSLAVVLWEMTLGERLHAGDGSELAIARAIVDHDAPRPSIRRPGYPAELERIVMRGLSRDPLARYQSADEMQADLEACARTVALWTSARELGGFLAEVFPDRLQDWSASARGTAPVALAPRQTVPLPAEPAEPAEPIPTPPAPAAGPGAFPGVAPGSAAGRGLLALAIAFAGAAIAAAIVFVWGGSRASEASSPGIGSGAPVARVAAGEDRHGFQPDDYLVSRTDTGYRGERLDYLYIAKPLGSPPAPGMRAKFLAADGREIETEHYWKTRIAARADLAVGAFALCCAGFGDRAAVQLIGRATRTSPWILGRITDVSRLDAGEVEVADVRCDAAGVRAIAP